MNSELLDSFKGLNEQSILLASEIKERRDVENRLLLTLEILENSKEAIFIADDNKQATYINKSFVP